jgi:hypothetical protein
MTGKPKELNLDQFAFDFMGDDKLYDEAQRSQLRMAKWS